MKRILELAGILCESKKYEADEGFVVAVARNAFEITKQLLDWGIKLGISYGIPLKTCVRKGYTKIAKLLLDSGFDPAVEENFCIKAAASKNRLDIVKLLVKYNNIII